ncbi:transcription repressor OFP6-like [Momordica charantia]|uniref:Transcription repressor n=1 Tax=Momordica charantia TaxID=3673 RepID=A0A6J1CNP4_MOMCH|nr:transcription repressor OFP6-like [Momordica charantia]
MSNFKKKKFPKSIFAPTAAGCGGCGKPKPSDIVEPDAKPSGAGAGHNPKPRSSSSSSGDRNGGISLEDEDCTSSTTTTISGLLLSPPPTTTIGGSIIAVEKNSDDPYEDFRDSMLQMIIEKKIYSTAGLQELLNCFLHLNSPFHHEIIVKAFTEIWDEFMSHSHGISDNSGRKPPSAGEG